VRPALTLAVFTVFLLAPAPSTEGAGAARPRVALSVSPARLAVATPGSRTIKLRNDGAERVVVDVSRRTLGGQAALKTWLRIVPTRVVLRSGESAIVTLRVKAPRHAEPGDHQVLVQLTTRPLRGGRVNVQVRLGVRIRIIVSGRIVRRLTLGGLRVHRQRNARIIFVPVANHGNVTVQLGSCVTASLIRHDHALARLNPPVRRPLRPGARAVLALRYGGRARGLVTAVVRVRLGAGLRVVERRYRIRL
jgi:hypothetical protein